VSDRSLRVLLAVSLVVALIAGIGSYRVLGRLSDVSQEIVTVVAAKRDLEEGQRISAADLQTLELSAAAAPVGAFTNASGVVGRVTRAAIFRGEAIVAPRLAPVGSGTGIEVRIPAGKRAMAVRIDDVAGLSGLVQPGSRVDVLVTITTGDVSRSEARLFMSNLRVLSVGSQVERSEAGDLSKATTATLEVSPEEAERLAVASNQGKIQLVLRGYGDDDEVRTGGATVGRVLSTGMAAADSPATTPRAPSSRAPSPRPAPARTRSTRGAPAARPDSAARAPVNASPAPASVPDTTMVQIYRRDRVTQSPVTRPLRPDTLPRSGSW
jgi:pilus assembly protein CpaB